MILSRPSLWPARLNAAIGVPVLRAAVSPQNCAPHRRLVGTSPRLRGTALIETISKSPSFAFSTLPVSRTPARERRRKVCAPGRFISIVALTRAPTGSQSPLSCAPVFSVVGHLWDGGRAMTAEFAEQLLDFLHAC
jgi:hypothetical protein